jgi:hypothetical protein
MYEVSKTEFKYMKKYNKEFNEKDYEDKSDEYIRLEFKEWYSKHLPVDLLTWMRIYEPEDEMCYKQGYWDQAVFIRDTICGILYDTYEEYKGNPCMVISTHMSKSIILPVYQINLDKYGVKLILRYNFYDWKVSVISKRDINCDFSLLFNEKENINSIYCEGFKEELVFGMFKDNKKEFTIEIGSKYNLYTFMFLLKRYLICM